MTVLRTSSLAQVTFYRVILSYLLFRCRFVNDKENPMGFDFLVISSSSVLKD